MLSDVRDLPFASCETEVPSKTLQEEEEKLIWIHIYDPAHGSKFWNGLQVFQNFG
jgi:hypothetical protein